MKVRHLTYYIFWASYGAYLGHVWGIIWGMSGACLGVSSGACLGQSKISAVLHASLMPFLKRQIHICSTQLNAIFSHVGSESMYNCFQGSMPGHPSTFTFCAIGFEFGWLQLLRLAMEELFTNNMSKTALWTDWMALWGVKCRLYTVKLLLSWC